MQPAFRVSATHLRVMSDHFGGAPLYDCSSQAVRSSRTPVTRAEMAATAGSFVGLMATILSRMVSVFFLTIPDDGPRPWSPGPPPEGFLESAGF